MICICVKGFLCQKSKVAKKGGIFSLNPLCNLNTCESFCPLLKIIPPRTSAGQEGLLSPISSSIPLSTKVSDKRLISFLSSQRGPISRAVNWPFPIASVHLLETIWKLIQLSDHCPSDAKTCLSDAGRKQKHCKLTSLSPLFTLCWTFHVLFFENPTLGGKCWSTKLLIVVWHARGLEKV